MSNVITHNLSSNKYESVSKISGKIASPNNEQGRSDIIQNSSIFLPIKQGYLTAF